MGTEAMASELPAGGGELSVGGGHQPAGGGHQPAGGGHLTAAQRARMERQRLRARALHDARLLRRPPEAAAAGGLRDTGGGFLLPAEAEPEGERPGRSPTAPSAPLVHRSLQPPCRQCARPIALSFLLDTFDYPVCDDCRDDDGEHALVARTEAKSEFLLKDCDLDARQPPLRALRRRNPHRGAGDMRLYLRAQLADRAALVWGSTRALAAERARRQDARTRAQGAAAARRLRALRLAARSSLFERAAPHAHSFGPERRAAAAGDDDDDDDMYERECATCGHVDRYEKL